MSHRTEKFVLQFTTLFLVVLLAMFALFLYMRHYDGSPFKDGVLNFSEAFRVNLFLINLSLLLIVESLLIFIFVRYTVVALALSSGLVVGLMAAGQRVLDRETMRLWFSRLAHNEYASLGLRDVVMLFLLNALLLAFLVAMMHHYQDYEARRAIEAKDGEAESGHEGAGRLPEGRPPTD